MAKSKYRYVVSATSEALAHALAMPFGAAALRGIDLRNDQNPESIHRLRC
jgi:hypothetical protein